MSHARCIGGSVVRVNLNAQARARQPLDGWRDAMSLLSEPKPPEWTSPPTTVFTTVTTSRSEDY